MIFLRRIREVAWQNRPVKKKKRKRIIVSLFQFPRRGKKRKRGEKGEKKLDDDSVERARTSIVLSTPHPPPPSNDCRYCSSRNFLKSGVDEKSFAVKATKWVVHRAGGHCSPSFRLISRPLLYRPDIRLQEEAIGAVWGSAASGISFPRSSLKKLFLAIHWRC